VDEFCILRHIHRPIEQTFRHSPTIATAPALGRRHKPGILRQVADDFNAGAFERLAPFRFDRSHKLNELKPSARKRTREFSQCPCFWRARVQCSCVELNGIKTVNQLGAAIGSFRGRRFFHFNELKTFVIGQQFAALRDQRFSKRAISHTQLVRPGQCRGRHEQQQKQTQTVKNRIQHKLQLLQPNGEPQSRPDAVEHRFKTGIHSPQSWR
jgi:hypothetical protein